MPRLHVRGLCARTGQRQSCDVPRLTACTSTTSRQFKRCGARVFLSGRSLRTSRNPIRLSATMAPMSQIRDHDFATKSQVRLCGAEGNRTPDPRLAKAVARATLRVFTWSTCSRRCLRCPPWIVAAAVRSHRGCHSVGKIDMPQSASRDHVEERAWLSAGGRDLVGPAQYDDYWQNLPVTRRT